MQHGGENQTQAQAEIGDSMFRLAAFSARLSIHMFLFLKISHSDLFGWGEKET